MILYQKVTPTLTLKLVKEKGIFEIQFIHSVEAPHLPGCIGTTDIIKLREQLGKMTDFLGVWLKNKDKHEG